MDLPESDIRQALVAARNGNFPINVLRILRKIIRDGQAAQFVRELIQFEQASGKTPEEATSRAMKHLESLGNADDCSACILLTYLSPLAGALYLHDVCDAIDFWICECRSPILLSELILIASAEPNAAIRRHYEQWLQAKIQKDVNEYLYIFGFEDPSDRKSNMKNGTDYESSRTIRILASSEEEALLWGDEIAERFVQFLYRDVKISWKADRFASWIEKSPDAHLKKLWEKFPVVNCGEFPDFTELDEAV